MFDNFTKWYTRNYTEITWFIIGFLSMDLIVQLGRGNMVGALISAILIALNYQLNKRK